MIKLNASRNVRPQIPVAHTRAEGARLDVGGSSFQHEALLYAGEDGFVRGALPFVNDGVAKGEPVLVSASRASALALREALGDDAARVRFVGMHLLWRNPARVIPAWRELLQTYAPDGRPVRAIGEAVWAERSPAELTEWKRHESLLNLSFDGGPPWRLLCPYDLNAVDEHVIEAARRSHPLITEDGERRSSGHHPRSHETAHALGDALPPPSTRPEEVAFTAAELRRLRRFVSRRAASAMLSPTRTEQLVLAVNELATNSLRHGGGEGVLRMWREADTLVCEVEDRGRIEDPLLGCRRPTPDQRGGYGVWLANHLCDLVQIRATATGSLVRVHQHLL